ncbi:MAG: hypothetical protein E3J72_17175 [Planctomycetota bacterium]|nr:MAG: hypothetical protein E3J72_17175 [Planctomycetota bacterium]
MQPNPPNRVFVIIAAFASGTAALLEELGFFAMMEIGFGATHLTLAAITTAFLGGLALGSWLGGRYADRVRRPLFVYGVLEVAIGITVLLLTVLLPHAISLSYAVVPDYPEHIGLAALVKFIISVIVLLLPTTCMGATLPMLVRSFVRRDSVHGTGFAAVYSINTLGAMLGPLFAAFLLMPALGTFWTLLIAAGLNVLVGAGAMLAGRKAILPEVWLGIPAPEKTAPVLSRKEKHALIIAMILAALSGALGLIFEITWTKVFALVIGSTIYSFAIVLSVMLAGIALGSLIAAGLVRRIRDGLFAYACIMVLLAGSALAVAPIGGQAFFGWIVTIVVESNGQFSTIVASEFMLLFAVMLVPTCCMGAALPLLVHAARGSLGTLGRRIGNVYAANTIGAIVGAILVGGLFIPLIGLQGTLMLAVIIGIAIVGEIGFFRVLRGRYARGCILLALAVVLVVGALITPRWDQALLTSAPYLYSGTKYNEPEDVGEYAGKILFYREGAEGVVSVHEDVFGYRMLKINGKTDASTHTDVKTQLLAGYLPTFLRPKAKTALCIGLGAGITLDALVRGGVPQVDAVEISPDVHAALKHFGCINHNVADSPNVRYYIDDARSFVRGTPRKYDIIVSVPSNPWIAGVSHLFTAEFFEDVREKLTDDGVFVQWIQMYDGISAKDFYGVIRTFGEGFEKVQLWEGRLGYDYLIVGSSKPLKIDALALLETLSDDNSNAAIDFRPVPIRTPPPILVSLVMDRNNLIDKTPAKDSPAIHDDRNMLAFRGVRSLFASESYEILKPLVEHRIQPWEIIEQEKDLPALYARHIDACFTARKLTALAKLEFLMRDRLAREGKSPRYGKPVAHLCEAIYGHYKLEDEALHLFFEKYKLRQAWIAYNKEDYIEAGWMCLVDVLANIPANLEAKKLFEEAKRGIPLQISEKRAQADKELAHPPKPDEEWEGEDVKLFYDMARGYYVLGDYMSASKDIVQAERMDPDDRKDIKDLKRMIAEKLEPGNE